MIQEQTLKNLVTQWDNRCRDSNRYDQSYIDALRDCMYDVNHLISSRK